MPRGGSATASTTQPVTANADAQSSHTNCLPGTITSSLPSMPMNDVGSESALRAELASLPSDLHDRLARAGFDEEVFVSLARPLLARARGEAAPHRDERNRVNGLVEPPRPGDVRPAPAPGSPEHDRLSAIGMESIARGEVAFCVLAGGMATRMGGVVKSLVPAVGERRFLDLRLHENATWTRKAGRPVPLWLMTSEATDGPIRDELLRLSAPPHVQTFLQGLGLRLTPEGKLFRDDAGHPSTYAPGHGDLPEALRRSGLLSAFVAAGGKTVWIANIDNLGATIDPAILGLLIESSAEVLVEVAPKVPGDRGGIPVWAEATSGFAGGDAERNAERNQRALQVLEEFRLPPGFDPSTVHVFNTNTFLVRAGALLHARAASTWFEVEKKVDGRTAVQFERLLQELTAAMPAMYVAVPREGVGARFLPVKDYAELNSRRDEIRAVALGRGMM
jgi:UTP--glucose-1-phosphate uridylyltransferase